MCFSEGKVVKAEILQSLHSFRVTPPSRPRASVSERRTLNWKGHEVSFPIFLPVEVESELGN